MKSFTRSQHNIAMPLSNANEKRMDFLLRQEMAEHQAIISSHHKEMQDLRDSLKLAMQRFDSLYEQSQRQMKERDDELSLEVSKLQEKCRVYQSIIAEQKNTINSLYEDVHDIYLLYPTKTDLDKSKKEVDEKLSETTKAYLSSFQELDQQVRTCYRNLQEDLLHINKLSANSFSQLAIQTNDKLSEAKMDKDGISKQIKVYEQAMFVIEKKIENIYTLIERINKRG